MRKPKRKHGLIPEYVFKDLGPHAWLIATYRSNQWEHVEMWGNKLNRRIYKYTIYKTKSVTSRIIYSKMRVQ